MKIGIFYNPKTNPKNKEHAQKVATALKDCGWESLLNPEEGEFRKIDLAIAVGGDGTVLYTANLLAKYKIPILGINFGHRGYLCEIRSDEIEEAIRKIAAKEYRVIEKTRIQAEIQKQKNSKTVLEALNEISVGGINRTVYLDATIISPEKTISSRIKGDGLIVSTKTGSSAYNINAGGPLLLTEAFSVVANNAFFESDFLLPVTKSIIVPSETIIKIKDLSYNSANLPFVIADGQNAIKISKDDLIIIKQSPNKNYFVVF